ncbi:matrixin family metalloprotease [Anatilimnocola sp. NA78]|uniref:matrixin family metalloprotease n=1 Tax=Anatilimnocola sp. NA78 TaxID=3415683 RepID=UPI003CE58E00
MSTPTLKVAVQAWILDLYPSSGEKKAEARDNPKLRPLTNGLAIPSFWSKEQIDKTFQGANKIWAQAKIEFGPVTIGDREMWVPDDDTGMWIEFVNKISPNTGTPGVGVGFVYDLAGKIGGVGGGKAAVIALKKGDEAVASYFPSILAHELGHCLLGHEHNDDASNLMFEVRHPKRNNPDKLTADQITAARARASSLKSG